MSVEKLDFNKVTQEKIPYTLISTKVIQSIEDPIAGFIWIYLSSLPPGWEVNKAHLKNKFKIGDDKLERILSYLKRVNLIEYLRMRKSDGKLAQVTINVLCGDKFIEQNQQLEKCATTPLKTTAVVNHPRGSGVHIKEIKNINTKEDINKNYCASEEARLQLDTRFEDFWKSYPRRKDKVRARQIWVKQACDKIADTILQDITNRVRNDAQWKEEQYIPHPSTYLRNKRWEDEITLSKDKPKKETGAERAWRMCMT